MLELPDNIIPFVQSCIAGDSSKWSIIQATSSHYLKIGYKPLSDHHDDISQEVALKLHNGLRQFHGSTKYELLAFIKTTVFRETMSFLKREGRQSADESLNDPLNDDSECTMLDTLIDDRFSSESIAVINDLLAKAKKELSIKDFQILVFKIEGHKDKEIAAILGMTTGGVAVTYSRIKNKMQAYLFVVALIILLGRKMPWVAS